jgi:hypothetical protein
MFGGWLGGSGPQAGEPVTYPECETPTNDAELRALIEKKFEQFLTLTRASGWNNIPVTEEGMTDLELSDIKQEGSTVDTVRVVGTLNVKTDALAGLLMTQDLEVYKNWDPDCLEIRPVSKVDDTLMVNFARFAVPYPLTERCFVLTKGIKRNPDGSILIVQASINHKDFKYDPNMVRGVVYVSGYLLTPADGKTKMIRITQLDPKGNIPTWVVNMFKGKAAKGSHQLRMYAQKGL